MPRSGSTLVEQILASHPQVEGGGELFELQNVIDRTFGANISGRSLAEAISRLPPAALEGMGKARSEEHTSELQSLMRISYAVFCLKKKNILTNNKIIDY